MTFIYERPSLIQNQRLPDRRIIALSPVAQIFTPFTNIDQFLDDPSSVFEKPKSLGGKAEEITVEVPLSNRTYQFVLGRAYTVSAEEALMLVGPENGNWSRMTNGTGLVYFDIPDDELAAFQYATTQKQKIPKELQAKIDECLEKARQWSERRVIDYLKQLFNDIQAGRSTLKQNGGEPPPPNDYEMLYTFILKEQIRDAKNRRRALMETFKEASSEITQEDALSL